MVDKPNAKFANEYWNAFYQKQLKIHVRTRMIEK